MSYKYILFDLDGTLTDPKVGITKSVQYALQKKEIFESSLKELEKFIGPPLKESFMEYYSFEEKEAVQAIEDYREYFKDKGIFENEVYKGIPDMLEKLKSKGAVIAVATSKPTVFAQRIIEHFNILKYFDIIVGSNLDGTRTDKEEVIKHVLKVLEIEELDKVIMIGDRKHDVIGAKKNEIDSIGVLYGYGSMKELGEVQSTYLVNSVSELDNLFEILFNNIN